MLKLFLVEGNQQYVSMFLNEGWELTSHLDEADLVQFTGGADVSPSLYGEKELRCSYCNMQRDLQEKIIFDDALALGIPMAGICRGGQFLNVVNGGKMWQDVNNHAIYGTHAALDKASGRVVQVSSTHHQMMIPSSHNPPEVLVTAQLSTSFECDSFRVTDVGEQEDIEALFYKDTKSLCFQPHPEFSGVKECRALYFNLIHKHLGLKA